MASGEQKKPKPSTTEVAAQAAVTVQLWAPRHVREGIRLDRIITGDRLRPIDPATVETMKVSIEESGVLQKILIRPTHEDAEGQWYKLVLGGHRYAAMVGLGWTQVMPDHYEVRDLTDAQAALVEIDENLIRRELTPYERAVFIEARLKAWSQVYPERVRENCANIAQLSEAGSPAPKRGRPANSTKSVELLGETPVTMGFSDETAADLGVSRRTVYNALSIARGLSAPVHAKIRGSALGRNEGLLRQIAGVADKAEQLKVVEALSDGRAKSFSDALVVASGRTPVQIAPRPVDETRAALAKLWKAAPPTHREEMLRFLQGEKLPAGWSLTKGGEA